MKKSYNNKRVNISTGRQKTIIKIRVATSKHQIYKANIYLKGETDKNTVIVEDANTSSNIYIYI